jgi:hypothetical protein
MSVRFSLKTGCDNNLILWSDLILRVMNVQLIDREDVFKWNLHQNSQFSIHSLYLPLINNGFVHTNTRLENEGTFENKNLCVVHTEKG